MQQTKGEKAMFRRLFSPDSDLMIVMTWITDCIFLSLFWIIGCVPMVTMGAATAALYDAAYRGFRRKNKHSAHICKVGHPQSRSCNEIKQKQQWQMPQKVRIRNS